MIENISSYMRQPGFHFSEETKRKMSRIAKERGFGKWAKGQKLSDEWKQNIGNGNKGKKHTLEARKKMSVTRLRNATPAWNKGKEGPRGEKSSNFRHGMCRTRFYGVWTDMNTRCTNPKNVRWLRYGDRGIKVLWISFEDFKNDMYEPYLSHAKQKGEKNTTIKRIDNDGNYCKENCKWATRQEQAQNKGRKQ